MNKSIVWLIAVAVVIVLFVGCSSPTPTPTSPPKSTTNTTSTQAKKVQWTGHTLKSIDVFDYRGMELLMKRVSERTGGNFVINIRPAAELGYQGPDSIRILNTRAVEVSEIVHAFSSGEFPELQLWSLPWLIGNYSEFALADAVFAPYLEQWFEKKNIKLLYSWGQSLMHFWTAGKKIDSLADMKGLKLRAYDKVSSDFIKALGGAPVTLTYGEQYAAVQRGTVNGLTTSVGGIAGIKAWEVLKYANMVRFATGGSNWLGVNLAAYNELPDSYKVALIESAREAEATMRQVTPDYELDMFDKAVKEGIVINEINPATIAEMKKITTPIREDFIKAYPALKPYLEKYEKLRKVH